MSISGETMTANLKIVSREKNSRVVTIRKISGAENLTAGAKPVENPNLEEADLTSIAIQGHTNEVSMSEEEMIPWST